LDAVQGGTGSVVVAGWAIDPDTASPIAVHVYVDGQGYALGASLGRPDVAAVFPSCPATGSLCSFLSSTKASLNATTHFFRTQRVTSKRKHDPTQQCKCSFNLEG
jgi:hypothetical protein